MLVAGIDAILMLKELNNEDGIELTMDESELLVSKFWIMVALFEDAILAPMKFFLNEFILLRSIEETKLAKVSGAVLLKMARGIPLAIEATLDKDWFTGMLAPSDLAKAGGICLLPLVNACAIETESDWENAPICAGVNKDIADGVDVKYDADGAAVRLAKIGNDFLHVWATLVGKSAMTLKANEVTFVLNIVFAGVSKRLKLQSGLHPNNLANLAYVVRVPLSELSATLSSRKM